MARSAKTRKYAVLALTAPVALLSACSPHEPVATGTYTPPAVWTGSPAPGAPAEVHGASAPAAPAQSSAAQAPAVPADALTAKIIAPDGSQVAAATIEFNDGFATVTIQTSEPGKLTPGPHGLHIHAVGRCEANSVGPEASPPSLSMRANKTRPVAGSSTWTWASGLTAAFSSVFLKNCRLSATCDSSTRVTTEM